MDKKKGKMKLTKLVEHIIDVENYTPISKQVPIQTIDEVLQNNNLFRIKPFVYSMGDCLFYSFYLLLHMQYTSLELHNGIIDHFINRLELNDAEALFSYKHELDAQALYEMHGLNDIDTYL